MKRYTILFFLLSSFLLSYAQTPARVLTAGADQQNQTDPDPYKIVDYIVYGCNLFKKSIHSCPSEIKNERAVPKEHDPLNAQQENNSVLLPERLARLRFAPSAPNQMGFSKVLSACSPHPYGHLRALLLRLRLQFPASVIQKLLSCPYYSNKCTSAQVLFQKNGKFCMPAQPRAEK